MLRLNWTWSGARNKIQWKTQIIRGRERKLDEERFQRPRLVVVHLSSCQSTQQNGERKSCKTRDNQEGYK